MRANADNNILLEYRDFQVEEFDPFRLLLDLSQLCPFYQDYEKYWAGLK